MNKQWRSELKSLVITISLVIIHLVLTEAIVTKIFHCIYVVVCLSSSSSSKGANIWLERFIPDGG